MNAPHDPSASVDPLPDPLPSAALRPGDGGGRAVLVVDSISVTRKFLTQRLATWGYRAQGVARGEDALERVRHQPFAIVFCERALGPAPGQDSLALCHAIKLPPPAASGPAPAFVVMTGQLGATDRVRGSLAGCDAYLTRPLDETALLEVLTAVDPAFR